MSLLAAPTLLLPPLHLRRIEPDRNMARYYTLSVEITLFEDWSCTRAFGRIGSRGGRMMMGLFGTRDEAEEELFALLRKKRARGYTIVGAADANNRQA